MRRFRIGSVVTALALLGSTNVFASGFSIFEQGAKATGMAGAFAATADDPSAIFYNVAGIAYQRKLAATAGGTAIVFKNEFRGDDSAFPGSDTSSNFRAHTFVVPNAYAVVPIGENLTFGIGTFSAFGLRTEWENANRFAGRFISQDASVKTASVEPAMAWKSTNGMFAVGVGAEYRRSHITLERNIPQVFLGRVYDAAHARLDSEWSDAWGYNVGVIIKPVDTFSIGLNYRSDMDIDYTGDATFTQISTGIPALDAAVKAGLPPAQGLATTISYPGFYTLAIGTTALPGWQIEADVVRTTWSRFDRLLVEFDQTPSRNLDVVEDWHDSNSYRIGANKAATENWDVRLGALYDETPQPLEGVGPLLPDADRVGLTFGVGFHNENWRVDVSQMVLQFHRRDTNGTNRDNFNGSYKTDAYLTAVNVGYNF